MDASRAIEDCEIDLTSRPLVDRAYFALASAASGVIHLGQSVGAFEYASMLSTISLFDEARTDSRQMPLLGVAAVRASHRRLQSLLTHVVIDAIHSGYALRGSVPSFQLAGAESPSQFEAVLRLLQKADRVYATGWRNLVEEANGELESCAEGAFWAVLARRWGELVDWQPADRLDVEAWSGRIVASRYKIPVAAMLEFLDDRNAEFYEQRGGDIVGHLQREIAYIKASTPQQPPRRLPEIAIGTNSATVRFEGETFSDVHLVAAEALKLLVESYPLSRGIGHLANGQAGRLIGRLPAALRARCVNEGAAKGYRFEA